LLIQKDIEKKKNEAGKNLHRAGNHIRRDKFFAILAILITKDNIHSEQRYQEEKEQDVRHRGRGELREKQLEQQRQASQNDGEHDDAE
jgi:hypothetical protein